MKKKRICAFILSIAMLLALCSCSSSTDENNDEASSDYESSSAYSTTVEDESDELTDDEIEALVVQKLYTEINDEFYAADAGSCTFKINSTEVDDNYGYGSEKYHVYGTVTLYDKYGELAHRYSDGSGSPFCTFEVTIKYWNGTVQNVTCTID